MSPGPSLAPSSKALGSPAANFGAADERRQIIDIVARPWSGQTWCVVAESEEISREPMRRILLEGPVVLFRTEQGRPVALFDRRPHRFAPLSPGKVSGAGFHRRYHGRRFGCSHRKRGGCSDRP